MRKHLDTVQEVRIRIELTRRATEQVKDCIAESRKALDESLRVLKESLRIIPSNGFSDDQGSSGSNRNVRGG